jgi:hypothetical protein
MRFPMNELPELSIDWDWGTAELHPGRRPAAAPARLRTDVPAELHDRVDALLREAGP